jgi:opacity protein-like surface antigen
MRYQGDNLKKTLCASALAALLASGPAAAIDSMSIELGHGEDVDMGRVGIQWDWDKKWFADSAWHLTGYWDLQVGYWNGDKGRNSLNDEIWDLGFTPVFRLEPSNPGSVAPYVEAGIGAHLLSETKINDKQFSTAFQFGDHIGAGLRFGDRHAYELGYRFQHLSNASIKRPNDGINFHQVRLMYHF